MAKKSPTSGQDPQPRRSRTTKARVVAPPVLSAAPTKGPLARIFGVRHLSPGGAFHVARYIEQIQPTAILIEGPSDANVVPYIDPKTRKESQRRIFDFFTHKDLKPPFAMLAFSKPSPDENVESLLFPFASYSPEFVAAVEGVRRELYVAFMDLPAAVFLGMEHERRSAMPSFPLPTAPQPPTAGAPSPATQAYMADPWTAITKLTGDVDMDTWWERWFEHLSSTDAYLHSLFQLGTEMRSIEKEDSDSERETLTRERFMRRFIRETIAQGHSPDRILVICGAAHAPMLTAELPAMDDDELAALPRLDTTITIMPYSYQRLSSQSGYGAGNKAPMYFESIHDHYRSGTLDKVGATYLTEVARVLRSKGIMHATADVIESTRLARALAAMDEASAPTLRDLQEGAISVMAGGNEPMLTEAFDIVQIGTAMGSVPRGVPQTALQQDFYAIVEALRLTEYTTQAGAKKSQSSPLRVDISIDLSLPEHEARLGSRRNIFLSRVNFLGIGWCKNVTTDSQRMKSIFVVYWGFEWTEEVQTNLATTSLLGNTIEEATIRMFDQELAKATMVGQAIALARRAHGCDLPDAIDLATTRAEELLVSDRNFMSLASALNDLFEMIKNQGASVIDTARLGRLMQAIYLRMTMTLREVSNVDRKAASTVIMGMLTANRVMSIDEVKKILDPMRWWGALNEVADDDKLAAGVAGTAAAILLNRNYLSPQDKAKGWTSEISLERRVSRWLSVGNDVIRVADWLEAMIRFDPDRVISREHLWRTMSDFISALDEKDFKRAVVGLRRACAAFSPAQIRMVVGVLTRIWGVSPEEVAKVISTRITKDEMDAIARELGALGDLGL